MANPFNILAAVGVSAIKGVAGVNAASRQANTLLGNARRAQDQADDSIRLGEDRVSQLARKARRVSGLQKAGYAAGNISLDSGSAIDLQKDTAQRFAEEADRVRTNAWRKALGFEEESSFLINQASQLTKNANEAAVAGIFGTAITESLKERKAGSKTK